MKKILALCLALVFGLAACSPQSPQPKPSIEISVSAQISTTEKPIASPVVPSPSPSAISVDATPLAEELVEMQHLVHEFGETESLIDYGDFFSCAITYPFSDIESVDTVLQNWAEESYHQALEEIKDFRQNPDTSDTEGELSFHYNSYLVNDQFASIEEIGFYTYTYQAHPADIIKTFNIDLSKGTLIPSENIFAADKIDTVLQLLLDKAKQIDPENPLNLESIDQSWLENPLIRQDGIEIVLERGNFLPGYLGTQSVLLPYDALGDAFAFADQLNHSPTPPETDEAIVSMADEIVKPSGSPDMRAILNQDQDLDPEEETFPIEESPQATNKPSPREIDPDKPMIALTFDDGPSKTTPKILALLDQYDGRATFCMVGNRVKQYSDIVDQVVEQGSEIASHTWDHKKLTSLSKSEIKNELESTNKAIESAGGEQPLFLRPPYGSVNSEIESVAKELNMAIVNWSIDTLDWKTRNAKETYAAIMKNVKDGSIILCHDLHKETGDAMEQVIPELVKRGYQLVTVSELLSAKGNEIETGKVYRHK